MAIIVQLRWRGPYKWHVDVQEGRAVSPITLQGAMAFGCATRLFTVSAAFHLAMCLISGFIWQPYSPFSYNTHLEAVVDEASPVAAAPVSPHHGAPHATTGLGPAPSATPPLLLSSLLTPKVRSGSSVGHLSRAKKGRFTESPTPILSARNYLYFGKPTRRMERSVTARRLASCRPSCKCRDSLPNDTSERTAATCDPCETNCQRATRV